MTRISPSLRAKDGKICCAACDQALSPVGKGWKRHARLSMIPVKDMPGASMGLHARVVIRRFSCPNCLHLLDSETALPEDPFLDDIVFV
jgi:acetone carboxylase gamma subunit